MSYIEHERELTLQKEILSWLNSHGCAAYLNEIPIGMPSKHSRTGRRRPMNRASADIVGSIKPSGRALFIECKLPKHRKKVMYIYNNLEAYGAIPKYKFTKENEHIIEQANFLLWQQKTGALAFFAFSLDCVIERVQAVQGHL